MGQEIEDLKQYGEDCESCTPKPWPEGKTPYQLTVTFSEIHICVEGIETDDTYPEEQFVLTQDEFLPCIFSNNGVEHKAHPTTGYTRWESGEGWMYDGNAACGFDIGPLFDCSGEEIGGSGECEIIHFNIPARIAIHYGLSPTKGTKHEFLGIGADGSQMHRFCNRNGATNIKLKFDTNLEAITSDREI